MDHGIAFGTILERMTTMPAAKPIFTGEFCAFSAADADALTQLGRRIVRPNCRIAEVGSWLGNGSTQVLLQLILGVPGARVLCVDTWRGNPGVARHSRIAEDYDVFATFRHNTAALADRLDILISPSPLAAGLVADGGLDLVFIDADHRYASVRDDIAAWRPKVRPGGVLCGHDCESKLTPEIAALATTYPNADSMPVKGFKFAAVHAGCILAVHEALGDRVELMAEHTTSTIWSACL